MTSRRIAYSHSLTMLFLLAGIMTACLPGQVTPATVDPWDGSGPSTGWLSIYFSDPLFPGTSDYTGGPDEQLAAAIDSARLSIDVAVYSFNLWSIRDALIRAERRGVVVRMVMESDNMDEPEVRALIDSGIPVVGDQREGLMHDKFTVIDRAEVWIGSMNYTLGGAYYDDNNLIRIRSTQVAEDYATEFEEMFTENLFGQDILPLTPNPRLTIDGTKVEVYFSPDDGVAAQLLPLIQAAQESIHFMAFSFTSDELGGAIIARAEAGVTVSGVMDDSQVNSNQGTEYDPFLQAGLDVRLDGNADGLMHHKVIIIDREIVITGSYNFTASAEHNNDETLVILYNESVAAEFLKEFQRIFDAAQQ